ncbi:unnamed protein product [Prorocentrum cordatum]|uniref:Translation elongation factor P/YeiP central domain-containing protein n=1 Tax=Prorocentrum cordatum TaxID=2364126 RepID=A0ABN9VPD9_9DINO|nr:unnamed protein product [Polarella glacialis]
MFMDTETYEEKAVPRAVMGQLGDWLTEGVNVYIEEDYDGKPIFARLEPGTELIAEVEIAQGSTGRSDGDQQVTYTNGVTQAAPAYIKAGDKVLINQRDTLSSASRSGSRRRAARIDANRPGCSFPLGAPGLPQPEHHYSPYR